MLTATSSAKSFKKIFPDFVIFCIFLFSVSGCTPVSGPSVFPLSESANEYRSEVTDPEAKALYAYGQFRLFAADEQWAEAIASLERAVVLDPYSSYLRLLLAKSYLHEKMSAEAAQVLDELIVSDPENVAALELRGDIANLKNDLVDAQMFYEKVLAVDPDSHEVSFRLAMVLVRQKKSGQAVLLLEKVLEKTPDLEVARLTLARLYSELGDDSRAMQEYQFMLRRNPRHLQAALGYGKILEANDSEQALVFYQDILAENPRAAVIRQRLAEYYLEDEQFEKALEQLQEVRWEFPENTQIISQIGLLQLELQNWTSAEKEFRALLARGEHEDRNRYYLATALAGQGAAAEAIGELSKISPESEAYKSAILQLAYLYNDQGDRDRAAEVLQEGLVLGGDDAEAYYYLIAILGDDQRLAEATRYAAEAVTKYADDTRLLYQLGVLLEKQDQRSKAVETMERILLIDADHADALNFLAYNSAEEGAGLELALRRAQRAFSIKQNGYIIDTLGWIYFKLGRYEDSRQHLEEAGRLHPDDPVITEHLGDLYVALKLWKHAAAAYRKVLDLDAQAEGVAEKLLHVEQNL